MAGTFWDASPAYEQFETEDTWSPWDTMLIDGARVPGIVRVRSRKARRVVKALGVGAQREQMSDTGIEGAPIEIDCVLWTAKHCDQYAAMAEKIELGTGSRGNPRGVSVSHPGLAMLKVKELYIMSVGVPERHGDGGSYYTASIQAQEAKPKRKDDKNGKVFTIDPNAKPPANAIEERMNGGAPSKTGTAP